MADSIYDIWHLAFSVWTWTLGLGCQRLGSRRVETVFILTYRVDHRTATMADVIYDVWLGTFDVETLGIR
jgi:hypothetical protein